MEYHRYKIVMDLCSECGDAYFDPVLDEKKKEHPDWWDEKGLKRKFRNDWNELYSSLQVQFHRLCFYFEADCHGDSISLCAEHLEQALKEIKRRKEEK